MKKFITSFFIVFLWFFLLGHVLGERTCQKTFENISITAIEGTFHGSLDRKNALSNYNPDTKITVLSGRNQNLNSSNPFANSLKHVKKDFSEFIYNLNFKLLTSHIFQNKRLLFAIHPNAP